MPKAFKYQAIYLFKREGALEIERTESALRVTGVPRKIRRVRYLLFIRSLVYTIFAENISDSLATSTGIQRVSENPDVSIVYHCVISVFQKRATHERLLPVYPSVYTLTILLNVYTTKHPAKTL